MTHPLLPRQLVIDRTVWTVDDDPDHRTRERGDRGTTYPQQLTISIDATLPPGLVRRTLVHEAVHACWDTAELGSEDLSPDQVERIVSHLAPRILDLIADNDPLVVYLRQTANIATAF